MRESATKEVYHFIDGDNGFNFKSREVYKDNSRVIHYPFDRRLGLQKYEKIKSIEYHKMPFHLPHGFRKSWASGYGFTSILNPLIYFLEDVFPDVSKIVVSSEQNTSIRGSVATFKRADMEAAYQYLNPLSLQYKSDVKFAARKIFSGWFPAKIKISNKKYVPGQLGRIINEHELVPDLLSDADTNALLKIISTFNQQDTEIRRKQLSSAKEVIDLVYIETILEEFEILISQLTDTSTLEEKWHSFFKQNSWIFSQLFAFPMVLLKDKAYVGGKTIDDAGGKVADFIYKNHFSENVAIVEIKTHKKKLLENQPYRGNDVFAVSKELSGAINQALDQRDNLQKEFYSLSKDKTFTSFNSKCFVIVGKITDLTEQQVKSFELFRNNNKDVEVVTFDELHEKIKTILSIFRS